MAECMTLVVETNSLRPIFRWLRCRYRSITIACARGYWIRLLRVHAFAIGLLLLGATVILSVGSGALGQTADEPGLHSVVVDYHGRKQILLVDASARVADALDSLSIAPGHLDIVTPAQYALIDRDNFEITVELGQLLEIVDGEERVLVVAPQLQPREVVLSLGYQLSADDEVILVEQQGETLLLEIQRSGDYQINIDGQLTEEKALSTSVASILKELGHETEDIAYVRPLLSQRVSDDSLIVVYYDRPDQAIIIETQTSRADGQLTERELVYQVLYDTETGAEIERNLIEDYLIRRVSLDSLPDDGGEEAPIVSTSHRVGDLSELQKSWLRQAGVAEADWFYVDYIIFKESRWQYHVWNYGGSGAYGLCQALPASKMSTFGDDYLTNPVTQLKWCDWYAKSRYGGWQVAYQNWIIKYWW